MNALRRSINPRWHDALSFDQRLQFYRFRTQVLISLIIVIFGIGALTFDLGVARRLAPWICGAVNLIIGWWMPSPGNPPQQQVNQTEINRPFVAIQSTENGDSTL